MSLFISNAAMLLSLLSFIFDDSFLIFSACVIIAGVATGPLWTTCLYKMSKVAARENIGTIVGVLGTSKYVASYFCDIIFSYLSDYHSWKQYFVIISIPVLILIVINLAVFKCNDNKDCSNNVKHVGDLKYSYKHNSSYLKIPGFLRILLSITCIKLIKVLIFQNCPQYFHNSLIISTAQGEDLTLYFKGRGFIGGIIIGVYLDKFSPEYCLPRLTMALLYSAILLTGMVFIPSIILTKLFLVISGTIICGSEAILCGVIPIRFAERYNISIISILSFSSGVAILIELLISPLLEIRLFGLTEMTRVSLSLISTSFVLPLLTFDIQLHANAWLFLSHKTPKPYPFIVPDHQKL